jgi:uncharacterized repeat protein (TIGR01451 family)
MKLHALLVVGFLTAAVPATAHGPVSVPPPANLLAPLLYVRFVGAPGVRVSLFPGSPGSQRYDVPTVVGLRPGYIYRVEMSNFPNYPGVDLYPTLEVRGSLALNCKLNPCEHPVPITLDDTDLERVAAGALVTKVYYLENPCLAVPVATKPDEALISEVRWGQDPLDYARCLGRPVLILRLGQRVPTVDELRSQAIDNTILLPGEHGLGRPAVPPYIPWEGVQVYDPVLGPKKPDEECFHDGGDCPPLAVFGAQGKLYNVDPSDTVAEYADSCHKKHIAVSNIVCLCVPRFGLVRSIKLPLGYINVLPPLVAEAPVPLLFTKCRVPPMEVENAKQPLETVGRERPSEAKNLLGPVELEQFLGLAIIIARIQGREVIGMPVKCPPECPLKLCKWADCTCAHIGDVVTFYLKYTNPGELPMSDIAVVDSLTGRLEYIPGSEKSDRPAVFTTQENEACSLKLRWEISGTLPPGESGLISFQVRVR